MRVFWSHRFNVPQFSKKLKCLNSKELDAASIPSKLSHLILTKTGIQTLPGQVLGNHTIRSITIENNHDLSAINKDAFVNVENLKILTLRQNRKLTWNSSQGSLFSLFRNLSRLEKLTLEANNITAKGKKEKEYDLNIKKVQNEWNLIHLLRNESKSIIYYQILIYKTT